MFAKTMMSQNILLMIALVSLFSSAALGGAAFLYIRCCAGKPKEDSSIGNQDSEVQQLNLSIRTTTTKVSFEGGSNDDFDADPTTTPHKKRRRPLESYSFEDLSRATGGFSSGNLIGGSVFHGRLEGKDLAVRRVPPEFVSRIDRLLFHERLHRHPCIGGLYGTCSAEGSSGSESESYLVLEYAKNGSLKDWLHSGLAIKSQFIASCECFLTWDQRLRICLDVARALKHMHQAIEPSYVHRNIKSRNIFLDEEFNAKLGNFGMANCVETDRDKESGYLAPEFVARGTISPGVDVFAYGVVLLEVLSGKPPSGGDNEAKLSDEIKAILESENAEGFVGWIDGSLGEESYSFDAAVMLANLARSCVEDDASLRPNAGEIVAKLMRIIEQSSPEGGEPRAHANGSRLK